MRDARRLSHLAYQFSLVNDAIIEVGAAVISVLNVIFFAIFRGRTVGLLEINRTWSRQGEVFFFFTGKVRSLARFFDVLSDILFLRERDFITSRTKGSYGYCRVKTADNHLLLMIEALHCLMRESTLCLRPKSFTIGRFVHVRRIIRNVAIFL